MIFGVSHRIAIQRSRAFQRFALAVSSEGWSMTGFACLVSAAIAGYFQWPYVFIALLFAQNICDLNDGYVYREKERGVLNGYGLYFDHILDSVGAAFVVYGGYCLLNAAPLACVVGLVLFYLIAIHSWLYKITRISAGDNAGVYFAVTVSHRRMLWLNVDDLTVIVTAIVVTKSVLLLYVTNALLGAVFLIKVCRATGELRSSRWAPVTREGPLPTGIPPEN